MQNHLENLNEKQREAATTTTGPLMVLAGAGSGKTKMLTSRITHLIQDQGVPAWAILAVTFTNKAAGEMRSRVAKSLGLSESGFGPGLPDIGTFHSICLKILRKEQSFTPFTGPFVIYDDSDQLSLIKECIKGLQLDDKVVPAKRVQGVINRAKCDAIEAQGLLEHLGVSSKDPFFKHMEALYSRYQDRLIAAQALDFGEILCLTVRLLQNQKELRSKLQNRYRFIHVDEYQDTNKVQSLFLALLSAPEHGGHGNLCVVGDEDQSIYGWRGADIQNILSFESHYPRATCVKLEQNYRSTQTIVNAAEKVIANNTSRRKKTLWTENEKGKPIEFFEYQDEHDEAKSTISKIKSLCQKKIYSSSDVAIFYRTNAQSRVFEEALLRAKMPYQLIGGTRFYDRKEIKDVLAYFRLIVNPQDSVSLRRIINTPPRGIGKTTLEKIESLRNEHHLSAWDAILMAAQNPASTKLSSSTLDKLIQFLRMIDGAKSYLMEHPRLSDLYGLLLDESGYVQALKAEGTPEAKDRIENLEELLSAILEYEGEGEPEVGLNGPEQLEQFLESLTLSADLDSLDEKNEGVKLMTLHASKGLEFPLVFIVGLEEGLFPSIRSWEGASTEEIEEERRLCYVGITRARQQLCLSYAKVRRIWGEVHYQEASRFLGELPESELLLSPERSNTAKAKISKDEPTSEKQEAGEDEWVGRQLNHKIYGKGKITALEDNGNTIKARVKFDKGPERKFLLEYLLSSSC